MKKTGQREITGTIHCISGIRIGGSNDTLQIGGTDLTCIKHPVTQQPYVPGSSLKGKLRSSLEARLGKFGGRDGNQPCGCAQRSCVVCRLFGPHQKPEHPLGPTRLVVRDAPLLSGGEIELKTENLIDRRTGVARHPRTVERVAAGAKFHLKIGIQIWDLDEQDQPTTFEGKRGPEVLVEAVKLSLRELQRTGLGAGVSKGYGEIELLDLKLDGQPFTL